MPPQTKKIGFMLVLMGDEGGEEETRRLEGRGVGEAGRMESQFWAVLELPSCFRRQENIHPGLGCGIFWVAPC